jgi:hypothetical protein
LLGSITAWEQMRKYGLWIIIGMSQCGIP